MFIHITIFLKELYDRNKDKLELQAGEPERLADIDKSIKEWQEEERIFQKSLNRNKPVYNGKEFEGLVVEDLFTQQQQGESYGKGNQHEMNSAANDQPTDRNETRVNMEVEDSVVVNNEDTQEMNDSSGTKDGTPSTFGTQDKCWQKGFESGMKFSEKPTSSKSVESLKDGFDAGRKLKQADDLELNNVVENISEADSVVENIAISAGIVEEKDDIQMEVVVFDTPSITTIKPDEISGYVHTGTTPSFGAIMDEVMRKATQEKEEVEEQTEDVDTTSGAAIGKG
ncbi:hypothetical protein C5167_011287 [Papaver somniferum]|uniref:Uncharacterized protein n=1 Tax=Papaver somniferum TaxID=3469 RepID=A0A4Y7K2M4_PAPSO|nr:hypothetical protein C5167_011287 [Papaver somniferum]